MFSYFQIFYWKSIHIIFLGRRPIAELLVSRGANVDALNALGEVALDIAESVGNAEVRAFLQSKTAVARGKQFGLLKNIDWQHFKKGIKLFL